MKKIALACIAAMLLTMPALSETVRQTVPAGSTKEVGTFYTYGSDHCTNNEPGEGRVTTKPKHGTAKIVIKRVQVTNRNHPCYGKRIVYSSVQYTANKGFRGEDKFGVSFFWGGCLGCPTTDVHGQNYLIAVK